MDEPRDIPWMRFTTTETGETYYEDFYKNILNDLDVFHAGHRFKALKLEVHDPFFKDALTTFASACTRGIPKQTDLLAALALERPQNAAEAHARFKQHEWTLLRASHLAKHADAINEAMTACGRYIASHFTEASKAATGEHNSFLSVPVWETLAAPRQTVDSLYRFFSNSSLFFWREKEDFAGYAVSFLPTFEISCDIRNNFFKLCGEVHIDWEKTLPSKLGLSDAELIRRVFKGTPILDFFFTPVPLPWRLKDRLTHTHIIGRTDSGKTTLMERMIHQDLLDPSKPSLVVMTPHGDLIRRLKTLASPLSDRTLLIDPTDENYPPAINPFSTKRKLSPNNVIQTFDFVLASLGLELTPKQNSLWKPVLRMLLTLPTSPLKRTATIVDVRDFMLDPEKYRSVVDSLEDPSFFMDNIYVGRSKFDETRSEIGYRLSGVLSDPAIRKVFAAAETKIDFYDELQNRKAVILIDTAKHHLADGSSLFGGMMLALIFQAIFARDAIPNENHRHPTFVYIDEAANYLTDDFGEMLTELRKFRCGLVLAHHELSQASVGLAKALVSQPGIRFAAPSANDTLPLAHEMNTTPERIRNLDPYHFAVFIRGITPQPIPTKITPLRLPHMSGAAQEVFKWKNRERVSFGVPQKAPPPIIEPPEDDDTEWV